MLHVSHETSRPWLDVLRANMYKAGDVTPFGDHLGADTFNFTLPQVQQCQEKQRRDQYDRTGKPKRATVFNIQY